MVTTGSDPRRRAQSVLLRAGPDRRFRLALEGIVAATVIMSGLLMAVRAAEGALARSALTEAFSLTSTVRAELAAYRAEHGRWPASAGELAQSTVLQRRELGQYVERIDILANGGFAVLLREGPWDVAGKRLVLRPSFSGPSAATVSWSCIGKAGTKAAGDPNEAGDRARGWQPFVCGLF